MDHQIKSCKEKLAVNFFLSKVLGCLTTRGAKAVTALGKGGRLLFLGGGDVPKRTFSLLLYHNLPLPFFISQKNAKQAARFSIWLWLPEISC